MNTNTSTMLENLPVTLPLLVSLALAACSGDEHLRLGRGRSGDDTKDGGSSNAAAGSGGAAGSGSSTGVGDNALRARIEDVQKMTIQVVTLACAGDCVDVEAVASGGNPPYTFAWADGDTNAKRHLCPDATTAYAVAVTDTATTADEFRYDAHTASAKLDANVLDCSDSCVTASDDCDSASASFVADETGKNPSGAWSYGYTATLGGEFHPYPTYYPKTPLANAPYAGKGYPEIAQWFDEQFGVVNDPTYAKPAIPDVMFNPGPEPSHPAEGNLAGNQFTVAPMQISMDPGTQGQLSVLRWTAASTGTFVVEATFQGLSGDNGTPISTTAGHVLYDGVEIDSGYVNLMGGSNSLSIVHAIAVQAGETIDFALSDGGNGYLYDFTAVDAKVCVPRP